MNKKVIALLFIVMLCFFFIYNWQRNSSKKFDYKNNIERRALLGSHYSFLTKNKELIDNISVLAPSNLLSLIETIKFECADAYPVQYAKQFIQHGGKTTNEKGIFGVTRDLDMVALCLERVMKPGDKMIDLGSGDGRIVFLSALYGIKSYGIEYDETLCEISEKAKVKLADKKMIKAEDVEFICGDFFNYDFSEYDVIYASIGTFHNEPFFAKLKKELKIGSFLILTWVPAKLNLDNFEFILGCTKKDTQKIIRVYRKTSQ